MDLYINLIVIAVLAAIVGGAVYYIYRAKKRGQKCIGCPYAKSCQGGCSSHHSSESSLDKTEDQ